MRIAIVNGSFRPFFRVNPHGSKIVGYLTGDLVFHCDSGVTCSMTLNEGLRVKINREGSFELSAPGNSWEGREGTPSEGRSGYKSSYKFDDATYAAVKTAALQIPELAAAVEQAKLATTSAPAPGPVDLMGLTRTPEGIAQLHELFRQLTGGQLNVSGPSPAPAVDDQGTVRV